MPVKLAQKHSENILTYELNSQNIFQIDQLFKKVWIHTVIYLDFFFKNWDLWMTHQGKTAQHENSRQK